MMSRVSLRLKLSDFINSDIEKVVMDKVNESLKGTEVPKLGA